MVTEARIPGIWSILSLLSFVLFITMAITSRAATYCVAPNCSDVSGDGPLATPWAIISRGDVIAVPMPGNLFYASTTDQDCPPEFHDLFIDLHLVDEENGDNRLANVGLAYSGDAPDTGTSDDVLTETAMSLAAIKNAVDNSEVLTDWVVVTAVFDNMLYVEQPDRSSGIRVDLLSGLSANFAAGDRVRIGGPVITDSSGERYIQATSAVKLGTGSVAPLMMNNRALGGSALGLQQGVTDGVGANNIGLLVKTTGEVTQYGNGFVIIDDGSGIGIRVTSDTLAFPFVSAYVSVTGVSSCWNDGNTIRPMIRAIATTLEMPPSISCGPDPKSYYGQLSSDVLIQSNPQTVLAHSLTLTSTETVYLQADGRYMPCDAAKGHMVIRINGVDATNYSVIDWGSNTNGTCGQHSFNCIGATTLSPGTYNIELVAIMTNGLRYYVGGGSNLCIMVNPADQVLSAKLPVDAGVYDFTTANSVQGNPLPHSSMLSLDINNSSGPVIAVGSGISRVGGPGTGDAMWGIYRDGDACSTAEGILTVNDLCCGSETEAPMYCHAHMNLTGEHTVSLDATEFPWDAEEDGIQYRVSAGTTFLALYGGMTVSGSAPLTDKSNYWGDWFGLCSTVYGAPYVPPGIPKTITSATVNIPAGHTGIVLFMGKTRLQCGPDDGAAFVHLYLRIDGVGVGSVGVQQVTPPSMISQRTLCCSYLAAGANALSAGSHTVELEAVAFGGPFLWMCTVNDCPLIWFD